jgi:hypothetical protein
MLLFLVILFGFAAAFSYLIRAPPAIVDAATPPAPLRHGSWHLAPIDGSDAAHTASPWSVARHLKSAGPGSQGVQGSDEPVDECFAILSALDNLGSGMRYLFESMLLADVSDAMKCMRDTVPHPPRA